MFLITSFSSCLKLTFFTWNSDAVNRLHQDIGPTTVCIVAFTQTVNLACIGVVPLLSNNSSYRSVLGRKMGTGSTFTCKRGRELD